MNKYLAKIIASDQEGLQMISACSAGAKIKVSDIKYLVTSKVLLLSMERIKIESDQKDKKINSICRFDFVDKVKSKNIDQSNQEMILEIIPKSNKIKKLSIFFENKILLNRFIFVAFKISSFSSLFIYSRINLLSVAVIIFEQSFFKKFSNRSLGFLTGIIKELMSFFFAKFDEK